jgi:WD40 repeat protein
MITDDIFKAEVEAPANPFPGLRPFEFHESNLYFGRDGQSERMLGKLAARRFVAVVGTSGSGKSSLVRAGLLPALFGGFMTSAGSNWRVALMRPGNDPIGNLARALNAQSVFGSDIEENAELQTVITEATLRRGRLGLVEAVRHTRMPANENLLVVVDQFEELFRFARVAEGDRYQNEAAAFVKLLLGAINQREIPIYVVLTLRSDYLGDCALFWDLPEAINESQFLIPRLTREQRREAITGPVAVCGGEISTRLVNRLLNDVGDDQDQLPILQHALMRAWDVWREDHAEGEPIDLRHYEAIGTMADALSRHADEAYTDLPDERSRLIAEKMFKGLTEKGADNREIRRPIELREICALAEATEAEVVAVIEPFRREGRSFLMPPVGTRLEGTSMIDISHESLIRGWGRLRAWVEEESRSARIYRRLAETAALYHSGEAGLWRDPDLQLAINWRDETHPNEAWARRYHTDFDAAMSFLEQSRKARDHEAQLKELARRRELRRTRIVAAVFLVLFLFSIAATVLAMTARQVAITKTKQLEQQTKIAEEEKANAQQQKQIAEQQKEFAETQKVKAEENFNEAETARKETLEQKQRAEEQAQIAHANELKAISAKAEAERQKSVAIEQERLAHVAESAAKSEAERANMEAVRANMEAVRANNLLYAADLNLAQQAFSSSVEQAQELLDRFAPKPDAPARDALHPELRGFEWYYLWQLYHKDRDTLGGHGDTITSVAFSPDNKTIATASVDGTVQLWDAITRSKVASAQWGAHPVTNVMSVAFSPDSRALAIAGDNTVRVWDTTAPQKEPTILRGHSDPLNSVAFSPDGKTLAAASGDYSVLLWKLADPQREPQALRGHQDIVRTIAFSPDGRTLASGGNDKTDNIKLWNLNEREPKPITLAGHTQPVLSLSFSFDGAMLASASEDGTIGLWDVRAPARAPVMLKEHEGSVKAVNSVAFSPDGRTLASGGNDETVRLWDTTAPDAAPLALGKHRGGVASLAFSQDGRVLASGGYDKKVKLWDITSQYGQTTLKGIGAEVTTVAYSRDGRMLATGNYRGEVKLWDALSRRELASFKAHNEQVWSLAYSPDGHRLATGGADTTVKLWNLDAPGSAPVVLRGGHKQAVYAVAISPDGHWLASGSDDKTIKVWNLNAPDAEPQTLNGHDSAITSVAYSPDGRWLASVSFDGTVKLWDLSAPHTQSGTLGKQKDGIWAVAFSPDSRRVATGGNDTNVTIWDTNTREAVGTLNGHSDAIKSISFSPDGRTIATGSVDKTVRLWSATSFQQLAKLEDAALKDVGAVSHRAAVYAVAFSPDGKTLASGSFDHYVKLWYAAPDEAVAAKK